MAQNRTRDTCADHPPRAIPTDFPEQVDLIRKTSSDEAVLAEMDTGA